MPYYKSRKESHRNSHESDSDNTIRTSISLDLYDEKQKFEKQLPPVPSSKRVTRNLNFKSPYLPQDMDSEVSTIVTSPTKYPGSSTSSIRNIDTADNYYKEHKRTSTYGDDINDFNKFDKLEKFEYINTSNRKSTKKTFSFFAQYPQDLQTETLKAHFGNEKELEISFDMNYPIEEAENAETEPEKLTFKDLFTKANLIYTIFVFLSFCAAVIFIVALIKTYTVTVEVKAYTKLSGFRMSTSVFVYSLIFTKIYQFFVTAYTVWSKNNTQMMLLFVHVLIFSMVELIFSSAYLKKVLAEYKIAVDHYASLGVDIRTTTKYLKAKAKFMLMVMRPYKVGILLICSAATLVSLQLIIWVFYLAKDFSWETFKKTGASSSAQKIYDKKRLFNSILVFIGGTVPVFFFTVYFIPLQNSPLLISGLVCSGLLAVMIPVNIISYKKGKFIGIFSSIFFHCYTLLNLILVVSVTQSKMITAGDFLVYIPLPFIIVSLCYIIVLNCKRVMEIDYDFGIDTPNLNFFFMFATNLFNFILGGLNLAFFLLFNGNFHTATKLSYNWFISYLFGFCYIVLLTFMCAFSPKHYVNFLSMYTVWVFNLLLIIFEFSNMYYGITDKKALLYSEGISLAVLALMSFLCTCLSLIMSQIFRNHNIEKVGTYNIENFKQNEAYEMLDFKAKARIVQLLEYLSSSNIVGTYLCGVYSLQFAKYSTSNWTLSRPITTACYIVFALMALINFVHHFIINKMKWYIAGLSSHSAFTMIYLAFPSYCMYLITKDFAGIENKLLFPEVTDLKIAMALTVVLYLFSVANVGTSLFVIKLQKQLHY